MGISIKQGAFKYPGGDGIMAKHILRLAPAHKTFSEPFVGGGATTWLHPGDVDFVVNDFDPNVAQLWREIKNGTLAKKLKRTGCYKATRSAVKKLRKIKKRTPLQSLALWRMTPMGRIDTDSIDSNIEGKPLCFTKLKRNIPKMQEKSKRIRIMQGDWSKAITEADSKDTFFYLDPPWQDFDRGLYRKNNASLPRILNRMKGIRGKFLFYHAWDADAAELAAKNGFYTYRVRSRYKRGSNKKSLNTSLKSGYLFVTNYPIPKGKWKEK